jgi:RecB family exonuclease
VGLRLAHLDGAEASASLDFQALCEERRRAQAEEEDRVLYVAMTRARDRLLLSGAVDFERWPEPRAGVAPIAWLGPALMPQLPQLVHARASGEHEQPGDVVLACDGAWVRCVLNAPMTQAGAHGGAAADVADGHPGRSADAAGDRGAGAAAGRRDSRAHAADLALQPLTTHAPARFDSLSYTTLTELERCGYRYYLEHVLGLEENRAAVRGRSAAEGIDARARGTLVHRLLEVTDSIAPAVPSAAQVAALARALGVKATRDQCGEIVALVEAALAPVARADSAPTAALHSPAARVARAPYVRREHPFVFSLGAHEPLLSGVIDVLAREADGTHLVIDYKTDRVGAEEDLAALVARVYELQRLLYALAVLRDGAPRVEIVHWFLQRPQEWVCVHYDAGERAELEARLSARIDRARARAYAVSEHPHRGLCETCPGRRGLCSWSEDQTMRDLPPISAEEKGF